MIIDTHVHIGDMLDFVLKKEDVISSMKRFGIDHSIVSSLNAAEFDHKLRPVKADYDLYKAINNNRKYIKAIKFHPYHSNLPFDGAETEPFIELAQHYGLPAVVHTGGCDAASCVRVYNAAKKFPKTKFVMVHMGLGTDNSEAIELISRLPNLFGDTTWVPVSSTLKLIRKAGIEKIMFGSDNPIDGPDTYLHNRSGERSLYQQYFNELKEMLSPEDYDRLMYKNASELFGIKF